LIVCLKICVKNQWDFFIGRVQITQAKSKWDTAVYVRHLERGDSFGEDALQA